jgi:hypothetical protein
VRRNHLVELPIGNYWLSFLFITFKFISLVVAVFQSRWSYGIIILFQLWILIDLIIMNISKHCWYWHRNGKCLLLLKYHAFISVQFSVL